MWGDGGGGGGAGGLSLYNVSGDKSGSYNPTESHATQS